MSSGSEMREMADEQLVELCFGARPGNREAAHAELTRRLTNVLRETSSSAMRLNERLVKLTWALVALTVAVAVLTAFLAWETVQ